MTSDTDYTASNRAAWDASAAAHEQGAAWQALIRDVAKPGFCVLDATLTDTLTQIGVKGRRTVQIGCNNGRELLSLPALGAVPALGLDQSAAFLDQARRLAKLAGSDCAFTCANIYDLPDTVPRDFDMGLITIGVLNWMPDLPAFLRIAASLLAPGAPLVIYETHPFVEMFEPEAPDPFALDRSYFDRTPMIWSELITYDGSPGTDGPTSYWFTHTLGDVVTGCIKAGLTIERLSEHPHSNREVDSDMYEGRAAQLPLCYTLVARRT